MTFPGSDTTETRQEQAKLKTGPGWLHFAPENIPTMFGVQFLSFPVSTTEKYFDQTLMTFPGPDTTLTSLEQAKLKSRPINFNDSVLHPKHTHNVWVPVLIVFCQYSWKIFRSYFDGFSGLGNRQSRKSWLLGTYDSVLDSIHTHNVWGSVLTVSCQYGWKIFRSNFDDFLGPGKHQSR